MCYIQYIYRYNSIYSIPEYLYLYYIYSRVIRVVLRYLNLLYMLCVVYPIPACRKSDRSDRSQTTGGAAERFMSAPAATAASDFCEKTDADVGAGPTPPSDAPPPLASASRASKTAAAAAAVADTAKTMTTPSGDAPTCPICLAFLCEPLRTSCGHLFCRACLLQTTQLSPDGRACPLCRTPLEMENPKTHSVDRTVEAAVRAAVLSSEYELRLSQNRRVIRELEERARTTLPVFYMAPGCAVGQEIALHLFEPRYRILIRAMEGNRMFVYAAKTPRRGHRAVLVHVTAAAFRLNGRANIVGMGVEEFQMEDVWVEEGTMGLYYTRFVARRGGVDPAAYQHTGNTTLDVRGRGGGSGARQGFAETWSSSSRQRQRSTSCAVS